MGNISGENGQQPMGGNKNQLTGKVERKFSVSNISHIKFIIYLHKKIYHCQHFGLHFLLGNMNDNWHVLSFN